MSSIDLAELTSDQPIGHMDVAAQIVSPGNDEGEAKDQDRIMLATRTGSDNAQFQFAIVCDGTTTSPYAAQAAEYVAQQVQDLFHVGGLQRTVEALLEMRATLLEQPLNLQQYESASLRSLFEEIVKQKYRSSYQTTFVAVCCKRDDSTPPGKISIKALACGDSALFIFRDCELLYNNSNVDSEHDLFKHLSPITRVLPDSYRDETDSLLFEFEPYPQDVHILVCSDGFYDCFANFKEIREWLEQHEVGLSDRDSSENCLAELHHRLSQKRGDDDISFLWLRPGKCTIAADNEEKEYGEPTTSRVGVALSKDRDPPLFYRLLIAILRSFGLRTQ